MKNLRALIIDDEPNAVDGLTQLLELFCPDVEVAGTARTVSESMKQIASLSPEIIFLDIHLREENGFDVVDFARKINCSVVFVTGDANFAPKAFTVDAVHYLLKPVSYKELQVAVARALMRREKNRIGISDYRLRLSTSSGIQFTAAQDIIGIEGDGRYSTVHMADGRQLVISRNVGEFEAELEPHGFFRVHKSWLVNCVHVVQLSNVDGGTVELKNGKRVLLSRRKKSDFLKRMEE